MNDHMRADDASDFLTHHGILGQRWGVRRFQNYDGTRIKNGSETRGSLAATISITLGVLALSKETAGFISDKIKKNRYEKEIKRQRTHSNLDKYKNEREGEEIDPETGLYKKSRSMTDDEDMVRINPEHDEGEIFQNNCAMCTASMELRQRGFDVHAGQNRKWSGNDTDEVIEKFFTGEHTKPPIWNESKPWDDNKDDKYISSCRENILSQGKDARGEIWIDWISGGGHSVYYKAEKGEITVYDTQANKKYSGTELDKWLEFTTGFSSKRLDNQQPNIEFLKSIGAIC